MEAEANLKRVLSVASASPLYGLRQHYPTFANKETAMSISRRTGNTARTAAAVGVMTALSLIAGIAGSAMAAEQGQLGQPTAPNEIAGPGQYLSMEQVVARLKEQGFEDIYEIEREHGAYEVKARTPRGGTVEFYVDPRTGDVLRHSFDD